MMRIPLDRETTTPLYNQIQQFLQQQIKTGALATDTRLPASRELAATLGVSRMTVINAYAELEAEGLVYSLHGSGTFVAAPLTLPASHPQETADCAWPPWQKQLARPVTQPRMEPIYAQLDQHPNLIQFTSGMGAVEVFAVDDFRKTVQNVLRQEGTNALRYGDSRGYPPLRVTIAQILSSSGVPTHPDQVLITTGSQQAISLTARLLLRPGDGVLIDSPTYQGAIQIFNTVGARLIPMPVDEEGMQVDLVEEALRLHHPRLIYTIPTFHNPTGISMSTARRRQLVSLAQHYNVPILEDDFVGDLRYDGRSQPALKALDPGGYVIYANTFSKALVPGLRIGFLVVSGPVYEQLRIHKINSDYATSNLIQQALDAYITVGRYQSHLRRVCQIYRRRRQGMLTALSRHLPPEVTWQRPSGGLFVWLKLPPGILDTELFPIAIEEGVGIAPGSVFFPDQQPRPMIRLNFSLHSPDVTNEGIKRLSRAIQRVMKS